MSDNPRLPKDDGKVATAPKLTSYMTKQGPGPGVGDDDPNRKPLGYDDQERDAKDQEKDDQKLLGRMRKRFDRCIKAEADNRKEASAALKFKNGEQWPADVLVQRNIDRRPAETVNYMRTVINQVTNAQRENRPSLNVSPIGERSDKDVAKMFRGLIRSIERQSRADIAYDTAFDGATSMGFGYFRMLVGPEGPDSFHDKITIQRIRNPFTVYLDPDHQEPDGADCRFGFVTEVIPEDEYKDEYPDSVALSFDMAGAGDTFKEWKTGEGIRVAEYFEITHEDRTLVQLDNGWVGYKDEMKGPGAIKREREVRVPQVKWYKVNAIEVLERTDWLGHSIPIYPVIGNEVDIEGNVKLSGLIKDAMGPQRTLNVLRTYTVETAMMSPMSPFLVEEGQIEGHEEEFENANTKPIPYLSYKGTSVNGVAAPPPQRLQPPGVPAALVQAAQDAANDLMATTGIRLKVTEQGPQADHRESGRMLREVRRDSDIGSFHFQDNFARTYKRLGDDLIEIIPHVYTEEQIVTILREDDVEEQVTINPNAPQAYAEKKNEQGKLKKVFNPTIGKYGVTADLGPSYATKRIEASESMMEFVKALPQTAQLVSDLIAAEMDWPGADKIAARLAKAIPPNLLTPEQKDMTPQVQALIQNQEQQIKQLTQQLQAAMHEIEEKGADRAVAKEKIHSDFSAKILGIVQKSEESGQKLDLEKIRLIMEHARHESDAERSAEQDKAKPEKNPNAS